MATKTGTRGPTFSPRLERLEERLTPAVQLDLSFDGDGKLTTHFGFGDDFAQGVALQGDGRILVAGAARVNGDDDFALARYNPDGSLDLSFGVNGGVTTDFGLKNDSAFAVAVDPRNGFIVAAGVAAVGTDQAIGVVRYTPDGRLDTSFGSGGKFLLFENDGADDGGTAVLVQDDGRILVGAFGTFAGTGEDFVLARLTADGRLDGSFGSGGFSRRDFAGGDDRPFDMALQSTGKILLVGQGDYRGDKDFILMRFNPDGTPDNSFGEFGDATTYVDFEGGDDFGYAVDVQPDDKIVVAGAATVGPDLDFGIARLDPNDGSYDPSFGGDGRVTTHFGHGHDRAFGVTVLPDGRILGTGSARIFADDDFAVAAYHPDGSRDTSLLPGDALSPAGTVTTDFDLGNDIGLNSVVQPDGSVVVVGEAFVLTDFDFAVARYSVPRPGPDGNIDTDRDGLLDAWEVNGLDVNGDGVIDLDLPGMGASPLRHDLFVEVDAMAGRAPAPGVLERVVRAFAIAPVGNPDGSGGISLHVFLDETNLPLVDWPAMLPEFYPVGAAQTRDAHFGTPAERAGGNAANILAARGLVFRYCVFGNTYNNGGSSGVARGIPGREFVVTLGAFPTPGGTPDQQAGTFMHELGHTLGLRHGGNDHVNNKPDYFSVMNYLYQFPTPANRDVWDLVYAGPDSPVYNDWGNIVYNFRGGGSLTAALSQPRRVLRNLDEPEILDEIPGPRPLVFAVGPDTGGAPVARLIRADGGEQMRVTAYGPGFMGGVRAAVGDFNGDGVPDLLAGPGSGMPAVVKAFDGGTGAELFAFTVYEESFPGGVFVAAGDFNGDGVADVVTSPDQGGGARVRVFDGRTRAPIADFLAFADDPNFRGGARVGVGDVNGDGVPDLVVGAGFGGGPRVALFDGREVAAGRGTRLIGDFFVFEPALRNGVYVAAGDTDGDGLTDLAVGGGPGGGPRVLILGGGRLLRDGPGAAEADPVANFFAGDVNSRGGVRAALRPLDADDRPDLITGAGEGAAARVAVYAAASVVGANGPAPASLLDFTAIEDGLGVFVG